jgi:hypothetical protein
VSSTGISLQVFCHIQSCPSRLPPPVFAPLSTVWFVAGAAAVAGCCCCCCQPWGASLPFTLRQKALLHHKLC